MKNLILPIATCLLALLTVLLGIVGSGQIIIAVYAFTSLGFIITNYKDGLYTLYFLVFISNGIVSQESYIAGVIGIDQIVTLLVFFSVLRTDPQIFFQKCSNKLYKNVKYIFVFLVINVLYINIKNSYYGLDDTSFVDIAIVSINQIAMYVVGLSIFKQKIDNRYFFTTQLICLPLFYSLTTILISFFPNTALNSAIAGVEGIDRFSGLLGNGDANTLAAVLAMFVAAVMFTNNIKNGVRLIIIVLSIIAIGLTGSRTGFGVLLFFVVWYIYQQKDIKKILKIISIVSILSLIALPFLRNNIERLMRMEEEQQYVEGSTDNRVGKWIFYLDYHFNNPETLIIGGQERLSIGWQGEHLVAHNYYIQLLYGSGIFAVIYFLVLIYYNIKSMLILRRYGIILTIQLLTVLMFVSDYGSLLCYAVCQFSILNIKRIDMLNYIRRHNQLLKN